MRLKVGDFVLIIIILAVAIANLALFVDGKSPNTNSVAHIIKDGEVVKKIKLNDIKEPVVFEVKGERYFNKIVAEKGRIHFAESNCPDRTCERMGWISKPGQAAACVPAGVIIKIVGESADDTDIIIK